MRMPSRVGIPKWTVGRARAQFAGLLKAAERSPQEIYHRRRLKAVVVHPDAWRKSGGTVTELEPPTLSEMFGEMRRIAAETGYVFPEIERRDRPNALLKSLGRRSR